MGKYPVDISEEDNKKLKYPFLPKEQYTSIHHYPDGPTIMIRGSADKIPKENIARMVQINRDIAARRLLAGQESEK
jgi:hypothetical protein